MKTIFVPTVDGAMALMIIELGVLYASLETEYNKNHAPNVSEQMKSVRGLLRSCFTMKSSFARIRLGSWEEIGLSVETDAAQVANDQVKALWPPGHVDRLLEEALDVGAVNWGHLQEEEARVRKQKVQKSYRQSRNPK